MKDLEKHHRLRLQRYAKATQLGDATPELSEDMMSSLQGLLTEARLDAAMKQAKAGEYDEFDLDAELAMADAEVEAIKASEEAVKKAEEERILRDAREVMGLSADLPAEVVEAKVEEAVAEAEKGATEDEKKAGFWSRIGSFFANLFKSKKVEG